MRTENLRGGDVPGCIWEDVELPSPQFPAQGSYERLLAEEAYERVVRTLERDIVPRLMLVRREAPAPARSRTPALPADAQVEEFVQHLLARDASLAATFVESLRQRGIQPHVLCLHLLAPAAARLGVMWEEDTCTFMQVTLGLCRLHQLLHVLCAQGPNDPSLDASTSTSRALVVALPGDQHTFGPMIAGHLLRRAGWDVWTEFPATADELLQTVGRLSFRIVGISVGNDRQIDTLQPLIAEIRRQSRCRTVAVVLGGAMLVRHPGLARRVGADPAPVDADEMNRWAESQLATRKRTAREG